MAALPSLPSPETETNITTIVADAFQGVNRQIRGTNNAWASGKYPKSLEAGHCVAAITIAGEGELTYKAGEYQDQREYLVQVFVHALGDDQYSLDANTMLGCYLDYYARFLALTNSRLCYEPHNIRISAWQDSGVLPRFPSVGPLEYALTPFAGFELTFDTLTTWPVKCT